MTNLHMVGGVVITSTYIKFIQPGISNYLNNFLPIILSPDEARKYQFFIEIFIFFGVIYIVQNWFSGRYR